MLDTRLTVSVDTYIFAVGDVNMKCKQRLTVDSNRKKNININIFFRYAVNRCKFSMKCYDCRVNRSCQPYLKRSFYLRFTSNIFLSVF